MALDDAKRIIRRLQHGDDIFAAADALGVTVEEIVGVLHDPEGSDPLPVMGGGAPTPLAVYVSGQVNGGNVIQELLHPATTDPVFANVGWIIPLQSGDALGFQLSEPGDIGQPAVGASFSLMLNVLGTDVVMRLDASANLDPATFPAVNPDVGVTVQAGDSTPYFDLDARSDPKLLTPLAPLSVQLVGRTTAALAG